MSSTDDIFASLGSSLYRDLLSDIDGVAASASSNPSNAGAEGGSQNEVDITAATLASLEQELANYTEGATVPPAGGFGGAASPPGFVSPSQQQRPPPPNATAAAFVVNHAASIQSATQPPPGVVTPLPPTSTTTDAWALSLSKFDALSLTEDFLQADSERKKKQLLEEEEDGRMDELVDQLFLGEEEYDLEEKVTIGLDLGSVAVPPPPPPGVSLAPPGLVSGGTTPSSAPPPGVTPTTQKEAKVKDTEKTMEKPKVTSTALPPSAPPHPMAPPSYPPAPMPPPSSMMPPPGTMMPPHMNGMPPPPHVLAMMQQRPPLPGGIPMGVPPPMMGMHPPNMGLPPGMMPPHMIRGMPVPPPLPMGVVPPSPMHAMPPPPVPAQQTPKEEEKEESKEDPLEAESTFKKKDFPTLGSTTTTTNAPPKTETEDEEAPLIPSRPKPQVTPPIQPRILFNNPHAAPIPATLLKSSLMPPRDLCYVIHSMLRPLQSLDAYTDDYYHWGFQDRRQRNFLMLGPEKLPNPVWKEVKVMARKAEENYRTTVEERSKVWSEEQKALGHVVKTNVKRPRALLSTPVLSTKQQPSKNEVNGGEYEGEEQTQRVSLWKARVAIHRGYDAYLNLVELRRLLQSGAGGGGGEMEEDLARDVKDNLDALHSSLGITLNREEGGAGVKVDSMVLSSTLSLPKGRILCARLMEGGILPHPSACEILAAVVGNVFRSSYQDGGSAMAMAEDRLLRALMGLVQTVQPSLQPRNVFVCLDVVMAIGKEEAAKKKGGMKMILTNNRVRMEFLHSVLSRGNMICGGSGGEIESVWRSKEQEFMIMLSTAMT